MRLEIVDELEEFIRRGGLWDPDELSALIVQLNREGDEQHDPIPGMLAKPLASLLTRMRMGDVPPRFADDVEGIIYPRLWKVMEAVRDGLPDGELRTRIEVLNRRLSRRFVEEEQSPEGDEGPTLPTLPPDSEAGSGSVPS
ncbi:MAG: hypothetical protein QOG03_1900 [Actinomycetota bacterium]|jgi:hypothetical protein|nr:hypothetical protein [Actinomycetota bacterium]